MKIVVTGSNGFIGKNLIVSLQQLKNIHIVGIDIEHTEKELNEALLSADFVYHLAGINRPKNENEFQTGNVDFTQHICKLLAQVNHPPPILITSSIQATRDNPYGQSKKLAENTIIAYSKITDSPVYIYRLPNVFGKWCRPNYNSVVATFCHNIAHEIPISISNRENALTLVYIDDIVKTFISHLSDATKTSQTYFNIPVTHKTTLGELSDFLYLFQQSRSTLNIANFSNPFIQKLYATYLSYLPINQFSYDLYQRVDPRGTLAEFVKSDPFGQIFVSRTVPGIIRGNHYHHLKTEKFLVLEGEAIIRLRHILNDEVIEYPIKGTDLKVVDIPPGYTHSIENSGQTDLITLFWASEIFNPEIPDTIYLNV